MCDLQDLLLFTLLLDIILFYQSFSVTFAIFILKFVSKIFLHFLIFFLTLTSRLKSYKRHMCLSIHVCFFFAQQVCSLKLPLPDSCCPLSALSCALNASSIVGCLRIVFGVLVVLLAFVTFLCVFFFVIFFFFFLFYPAHCRAQFNFNRQVKPL